MFEDLPTGGWCFILNEPNLLHTFSSYRVARLSNTHEIGFSRAALEKKLKDCGFGEIRILKNKNHFYLKPSWLAVCKK